MSCDLEKYYRRFLKKKCHFLLSPYQKYILKFCQLFFNETINYFNQMSCKKCRSRLVMEFFHCYENVMKFKEVKMKTCKPYENWEIFQSRAYMQNWWIFKVFFLYLINFVRLIHFFYSSKVIFLHMFVRRDHYYSLS